MRGNARRNSGSARPPPDAACRQTGRPARALIEAFGVLFSATEPHASASPARGRAAVSARTFVA